MNWTACHSENIIISSACQKDSPVLLLAGIFCPCPISKSICGIAADQPWSFQAQHRAASGQHGASDALNPSRLGTA